MDETSDPLTLAYLRTRIDHLECDLTALIALLEQMLRLDREQLWDQVQEVSKWIYRQTSGSQRRAT